MDEPGSLLRRSVVVVMGLMVALWVGLYFLSFNEARGQVQPVAFSFDGQSATAGKKVFQAYNCMGCHTIVGNGGYFAPDLTGSFASAGPAWLAAYLPSAGTWPTEALLGIQVDRMARQGLIQQDSLEAYYAAYPGARQRVQRRGGQSANMPNLPFRADEVAALIAFLSYTAAMDTEGWPPKLRARPSAVSRVQDSLHHRAAVAVAGVLPVAPGTPLPAAATPAPASVSAAEQGQALAARLGCTACHSAGTDRLVGPGWRDLYGSERRLSDGSTVKADETYLVTAITEPDKQVVQGYTPGVMPSFAAQLQPQDVAALVAYVESIGKVNP